MLRSDFQLFCVTVNCKVRRTALISIINAYWRTPGKLQWLNNTKDERQSLEDTFHSLTLSLFSLWQNAQAFGFFLLLTPMFPSSPHIPIVICSNDRVIEILKELQKLFQVFELLSKQTNNFKVDESVFHAVLISRCGLILIRRQKEINFMVSLLWISLSFSTLNMLLIFIVTIKDMSSKIALILQIKKLRLREANLPEG